MTTTVGRILTVAAVAALLALGFVAGQAIAYQPHMQSALDHLRAARAELSAAAADKGGHRLRAIGYVDRAIEETRAGIQYAR